jgi:hypothetical protein
VEEKRFIRTREMEDKRAAELRVGWRICCHKLLDVGRKAAAIAGEKSEIKADYDGIGEPCRQGGRLRRRKGPGFGRI